VPAVPEDHPLSYNKKSQGKPFGLLWLFGSGVYVLFLQKLGILYSPKLFQ
jgi:hypothetical protein